MREFLKVFAANANQWLAEGWGGDSYPISKRSIQLVNPLLNRDAAAASLQPLADFANSLPRKGSFSITTYSSWYQFYATNLANSYANAGSWGTAMSSRLIPASNLDGAQNQHKLVETLMTSVESNPGIIPMIYMSTPARTADSGTALTPAWRNSTWHLMLITQWNPAQTTADRIRASFEAVHKAMDPLRKLTHSAGVYSNEADVLEANPSVCFWGHENSRTLLRIKRQLDPNNVLQVHQGADL